MIKALAIIAAVVLLLILALAVGAVILFHPVQRDVSSSLSYWNMGDAVQVNYSETSFYMDNGSYAVNNTYTTVILDMTGGSGDNTSNGSSSVIVAPSGGNPDTGTGSLTGYETGRIIITLPGSSTPIVLPAQWVPDAFAPQPGYTWTLTTNEQPVQINGSQPLAFYGLNISSSDGTQLNDSFGSDLVVESKILVIEPGADYVSNGSTGGYNNEIREGQESWFESDVTAKQTVLKVDVRWKNPDNKLRLMVFTPDGHVLGPFYDESDDQPDGRINIDIVNPEGIAKGEWHYKVNGMDVQGKDDYYVRTG